MNKKHKILNMLCLVIISTLLSGCSHTGQSDKEDFIKLIEDPSIKDINKSIRIVLDNNAGDLTSMGTINLTMYNRTKKTIWIPYNANVQLFLYSKEDQNWIDVENCMKYFGDGVPLLPKGSGEDFIQFSIYPKYQEAKSGRMRVAVTGYIMKEDKPTNDSVSAYVEFIVK